MLAWWLRHACLRTLRFGGLALYQSPMTGGLVPAQPAGLKIVRHVFVLRLPATARHVWKWHLLLLHMHASSLFKNEVKKNFFDCFHRTRFAGRVPLSGTSALHQKVAVHIGGQMFVEDMTKFVK